jgi:hypothetical protein
MTTENGQRSEVLDAGQTRPEGGSFNQRPDPAKVARGLVDARAEHGGGPRGRSHQPEEHRHGGRLARAIWADEARHHTDWNLDAQRVDSQSATEALA